MFNDMHQHIIHTHVSIGVFHAIAVFLEQSIVPFNCRDNASNVSLLSSPLDVSTSASDFTSPTQPTSPAGYVWSVLETGGAVYIDRSFTYTSIPATYQGYHVLKTGNNDKASSGDAFVTFDISASTTIYIGYDQRLNLPNWMVSWTESGEVISTNDTTFNVFEKYFPAGTVVLGGNEDGSGSMYVVFINSVSDFGGAGSASLSWTPPTTNSDGSVLSDLAGYRIKYGTTTTSYTNVITISNPDLSSYVVHNLESGTYYFVVTAFDNDDNESVNSNEAIKIAP